MSIDTLRLTAEDARGLLDRGDVSSAELHAAYVDAIETRDAEPTPTCAPSTNRPATASRSRSRT